VSDIAGPRRSSPTALRYLEAVVVGVAGAVLGAATGRAAGGRDTARIAPGATTGAMTGATTGAISGARGLGAVGAVIGGLNGAIAGWRGIYAWRRPTGVVAFAADSTWALATTAASLGSHAIAGMQSIVGVDGGSNFDVAASRRRNRHVYGGGFQPRRGFVITVGNVVSGAGAADRAGRARLVDVHENAHVWQARAFGPLYPLLYASWMAVGAIVGTAWWLVGRCNGERGWFDAVELCAYYLNPFEWWAYSREGRWPPTPRLVGIGWRQPMVAPHRRAVG